jgi:hypothetical protein
MVRDWGLEMKAERGWERVPCRVTATALAWLVAFTPLPAEPIETSASLTLGAGVDSNPLRIMNDGPNGTVAEARYAAEVDHVFTRRMKWFFEADGESRFNESSHSAGDLEAHEARLGLGLAPLRGRRARVLFQLGALWSRERGTFLDRTTGEPFAVFVPGPGEFAIPDRYDRDTTGIFADAYWSPWKRTRLSLETGFERAGYEQHYPAGSPLLPLDHDLVRIEPGIQYRAANDVLIGFSVYLADLDYDEELARDAGGEPIAGSRRELRYADARLSLRWVPVDRLRVAASIRGGDRSDPFEGYYDSSTVASLLQLDFEATEQLALRLSGYWRDRSDAEIPSSELEVEQRQSDRRRFRGVAEWRFHPHVSLFGEAATQRDESWQPEYTHDRDWILAGVIFGTRAR